MKKPTRIRMLQGIAGRDFALSVGDVTDRFPDKEAKGLINAGFAEIAPPEPVKKPETKKEWDDERDKLIQQHDELVAENEALKGREDDYLQQIASLSAFKASVAAALGEKVGAQETAVAQPAPEKRG